MEKGKIDSEILDLMKQRIIGSTDRKTFAQRILKLKKKAQVLDASITNCKELLLRATHSPFLIDHDGRGSTSPDEKKVESTMQIPGMPSQMVFPMPYLAPTTMQQQATIPKSSGEERKTKIRKIRVLKIEKELKAKETEIRGTYEKQISELNQQIVTIYEERIAKLKSEIKTLNEMEPNVKGERKFSEYISSRKKELQIEIKQLTAQINNLKKSSASAGEIPTPPEKNPESIVEKSSEGMMPCPVCGAQTSMVEDKCQVCGVVIKSSTGSNKKIEKEQPPKKKNFFIKRGGMTKVGTVLIIVGVGLLLIFWALKLY